MSKFALEVDAEIDYSNRSWPDAAQHTVHRLIPGSYPLEPRIGDYSRPIEGTKAIRIDNHLLVDTWGGKQSNYFTPGQADQLHLNVYDYNVEDGKDLIIGGTRIGTFRQIAG